MSAVFRVQKKLQTQHFWRLSNILLELLLPFCPVQLFSLDQRNNDYCFATKRKVRLGNASVAAFIDNTFSQISTRWTGTLCRRFVRCVVRNWRQERKKIALYLSIVSLIWSPGALRGDYVSDHTQVSVYVQLRIGVVRWKRTEKDGKRVAKLERESPKRRERIVRRSAHQKIHGSCFITLSASSSLTLFVFCFVSFFGFSLKRNPSERGDLKTLMDHPWIKQSEQENVDFSGWVCQTVGVNDAQATTPPE